MINRFTMIRWFTTEFVSAAGCEEFYHPKDGWIDGWRDVARSVKLAQLLGFVCLKWGWVGYCYFARILMDLVLWSFCSGKGKVSLDRVPRQPVQSSEYVRTVYWLHHDALFSSSIVGCLKRMQVEANADAGQDDEGSFFLAVRNMIMILIWKTFVAWYHKKLWSTTYQAQKQNGLRNGSQSILFYFFRRRRRGRGRAQRPWFRGSRGAATYVLAFEGRAAALGRASLLTSTRQKQSKSTFWQGGIELCILANVCLLLWKDLWDVLLMLCGVWEAGFFVMQVKHLTLSASDFLSTQQHARALELLVIWILRGACGLAIYHLSKRLLMQTRMNLCLV